MKTRNLNSELRLKQKLITRGKGYPGNHEGRDGDFTVRFVKGRGLFFFYKWGSKWYSTRMSIYTPRTHERNEPVLLPKGRPPKTVGEVTLDIDGKVFVRDATSTKQQVLSVGNTGICDLTTFTGSSGVKFQRSTVAAVSSGSNDDILIENTSTDANAHSRITLKTNKTSNDASDSYINYTYQLTGESPAYRGWCVGMDGSATNHDFVWNKFPGTTAVSTIPSDTGQTKLSLTNTGNLTATGTVQGTKLRASSTASTTNDTDKFLCIGDGAGEDTYEIKYVTGATLLGAIGGGTSSVANLNDLGDVSYSSGDLTITSLDTIVASTLIVKIDDGELNGLVVQGGEAGQVSAFTVGLEDDNFTTLRMYEAGGASANDYFEISTLEHGATEIKTVDGAAIAAHLTLDLDGDLIIETDHNTGQVTIDKNSTNTATATNTSMQIDYDHVGVVASGQTITAIGLDLDMNCEAGTANHALSTVNQTGMDITLVAAADGSQTNTGLNINVSGGDNNYDIKLSHDATNYCTFETIANGATTISTVDSDGAAGDFILDIDGSIELNADGGNVELKDASANLAIFSQGASSFYYDASNYLRASISSAGVTTLITAGGTAADADFIVDAGGDIVLDSGTGIFIAKVAGTEFSASNSAYAGMILGFTIDGNDAAAQTYNLTTDYIVFDSDLSVTFKTPPSEKVEIQATFYYEQGNNGVNVLASIANHATYASSDLHHELQHERSVTTGAERGGQGIVTVSWYMIDAALEAIGASQTIYFAAKCSATTGTPNIKWGGDASGEYQNFVMKAIALPA